MRCAGVFLLFVLLAHFELISANYYTTQPPSTGPAGRRCHPPFGFRPNSCGPHIILNSTSEPVCDYLFGPNVCLFTDTVEANEIEYRYSQGCDWVYSHYYYTWVRQCSYVCQPTDVCLDETQVFVRTYEKCCPGFTSRRVSVNTYDPYSSYHYSYYTPLIRETGPGCPVAVADSILECLEIQGLTEFIEYLTASVYFDLFNSTTDSHLTLFAPTNEALNRLQRSGFIPPPSTTFFNVSQLVANHIVEGNVTVASLKQFGNKIYVSIDGRNLHRVSIAIIDQSSVTYPQNQYYYNPVIQNQHEIIIPFINGAEVVNEAACNTVNATLHIIDQVLRPIDSTIAEYLDDNESRFSMFTAALDTVGLLEFLNNPHVSRTVFAVEDDVFASTFPPDLMTCIVNYMRRPLNDILLYHIGEGAFYSSTLANINFFYTILGQFIEVERDPETGEILLGECRMPIIDADIVSASNGVIHVISTVLFPDQFDFGMCTQFVPTPSPVECPVELLPSPTPTPMFNMTNITNMFEDTNMTNMTNMTFPLTTP